MKCAVADATQAHDSGRIALVLGACAKSVWESYASSLFKRTTFMFVAGAAGANSVHVFNSEVLMGGQVASNYIIFSKCHGHP